jgi:hypothetical protein
MSYLSYFKPIKASYIRHYPSPSLAGPVAGRKLAAKVVTVMAGAEGLAPSGDMLLDAHLGISKAHQPDLPVFLGKDSRFLRGSGGGLGFVIS